MGLSIGLGIDLSDNDALGSAALSILRCCGTDAYAYWSLP